MKKLALVLLAGFFFASAHAQFAFGIKGGANISNVNGSDVSGLTTSSVVGFNAGAYLKVPLRHGLSLQPEVVYSSQGFKQTSNGVTGTYTEGYVNVPVLLKYTHFTGVFIETGPQIGFLASAKLSADGNSADWKKYYNSSDVSWVIGVGVKIPATPISLDARYNFGLSNIDNNSQTGDNGSLHNGSFQIGIMIRLFSGPGK
jgi:hypothetical protein